jgi:trk system potassium uptake protein TrkA
MNILILGSGIVGANLANKLSEQGKNVFLLDDDNSELKRLSDRYDIKTIFEDPLNPTFYSNFKTKIDYFIAVTKSDEKNIITCKFAKEFLKADKTIARIRNQNLISDENKSLLIDSNTFLDHIISPEWEVANNIFEKIHMPGAFFSESLISKNYLLIGMQSSDLFKHQSFDEIKNFFSRNNLCYIGHTFEEELFFDFKSISKSDQLYLLIKKEYLKKLIKFFGYKDYVLDILIIGGGNIGQNLSKLIEQDEQQINLKILEYDKERCDFLASSLRNTSIFHGDALDQSLYDEVKLNTSDLVITITDNDQINTILSIISKKRGSKSVFAVVNNESFSSFANDLGIDVIINPRELTTSRIIEKISEGSLLSYHSILKDRFLLYELKYKNELFENIKKSNEIKHICTISKDSVQLSNDEHIPVNNDVLVLLVEAKNSHILEKYINDY